MRHGPGNNAPTRSDRRSRQLGLDHVLADQPIEDTRHAVHPSGPTAR
jgi:hypothetical protein